MNKLMFLLPYYERDSNIFKEILNAELLAFNSLNSKINDLKQQLNIDTATWSLEIYEKELGIKTVLNKSIDERRSVIKSKLRGTGKVDAALIKIVADAFTNGNVSVDFNGRIVIKFNSIYGIPPNLEDVKKAIHEISPAHLGIIYEFSFILIKDIDNILTLKELEQITLNKFAGGEA